jgi:diguanylate cyclase (GGDEF)-like protein
MANRMQMNAPLFYLDIDRFKWINDNLGHAAGDQALRDAAAALKNSFRSSDIIARFGGDEFVVLAIESNENTAAVMLERLEENMRKLAHANPNNRLSFSIGLTHYQWDQPRTMEALLEEADRGMYEMKQAKKELQGVPKT